MSRKSAIAIGSLALAAGAIALSAPAGASTTQVRQVAAAKKVAYWTFKNKKTLTCLTAGKGKTAFVAKCNGSSYQKWYWDGSGSIGKYKLLRNKATKRCLETAESEVAKYNKVSTQTCGAGGWNEGDAWRLTSHGTRLEASAFGGGYGPYLQASPKKGALRAGDIFPEGRPYANWKSTAK
ncbi:RICIN domain-containing protein [Actinoallomurus sp. CA-150999]|uniref:RICIN domain-containing protein n=1 Tax=Actinoallomurus sp. CA-150999 TaxID=3239887 RepID=UPI003D909D62